jgi:hypothetical protein
VHDFWRLLLPIMDAFFVVRDWKGCHVAGSPVLNSLGTALELNAESSKPSRLLIACIELKHGRISEDS